MSKTIDSLFDAEQDAPFRLWKRASSSIEINQNDIIFQAPLFTAAPKKKTWKERYFVLTAKRLYLLKSEHEPQILAYMDTQWVRIDFIMPKASTGDTNGFCFKFIRNMVFTDLWTDDEDHFNEWVKHFSQVFILCNFHHKYNTIKMIGKGSFARVYMVEHKETQVKYAVKAFNKEYLMSQPKGKDSLINEMEILQSIKHPHIMNLVEMHESKNSIYLVLELLEGGELFSFISKRKKLTYSDVTMIMAGILKALAYMASKKIIHRDLKPDNLLFKSLESCEIKIADFGLATRCDVNDYLYKRCGTPGFIAPEVINASSKTHMPFTPKCDVFSAGVVFHILLTGDPIFMGKTYSEIIVKNKQCKIKFSHPMLKKNKVALDLLTRMLEVDPEKRITAEEALKHKFFEKIGTDELYKGDVEIYNDHQFENMEYRKMIVKDKEKEKPEVSSLIIRNPVFNGKTDTVKDSFDSSGLISSFKSMNTPKKGKERLSKRESVLKYTLLNKVNKELETVYGSNLASEYFCSTSEDISDKEGDYCPDINK